MQRRKRRIDISGTLARHTGRKEKDNQAHWPKRKDVQAHWPKRKDGLTGHWHTGRKEKVGSLATGTLAKTERTGTLAIQTTGSLAEKKRPVHIGEIKLESMMAQLR